MMKMSKKNWIVVALGTLGVVVGNNATNYLIARKNGYKWNKETRQMEKMCPFGIDLQTEDQIAKSNLIWSIIGVVVGTILHHTVIDK